MAKKAPFFSHDMNARHDPKISAMRGVYGAEGYGWFWMLVEMMAESDGYQLDCKSKYAFNAYAMQLQCKSDDLHRFVSDCIGEFELFETNENYFWSNSLRKRMEFRDVVSEKRAEAAKKRWEKQGKDANASDNNANAEQMHQKTMQNDANETKQNETKKHIGDSNECTETFERFWQTFPNKKGKAVASKSWTSLWKQGRIVMEDVISGTESYTKYVVEKRKVKPDFEYCYGSTFVNQMRWQDDWTISDTSSGSSTTARTGYAAKYEKRVIQHEAPTDVNPFYQQLLEKQERRNGNYGTSAI